MPTGLYDKGREAFLLGDIDWVADDIRVVLIDAQDYVVDLATHDFLDDVPAAARVGTPLTLLSKTSVAGVADALDAILSSVTGDQCEAVLIYQWLGSDAASRLIAYIDTGTGLPVTPNGANITIEWSGAATRIFKL